MTARVFRVGVVGLGGMGHHHAEAALDEPGVVLAAGCDILPEKRAAWGERFGVPAAALYASDEEMLQRAALDVVVIATHASAHAAPAIAAARRGVHVLCEKPPALDLRAAGEMVAAGRAAGVKLAVNHIKRGSAGNDAALRLIRAGAIGAPYLIRGECKGRRWAGSELMEMGTHLFDWLRLVSHGIGAGDPAWLFAHLIHEGRAAGPEDARHSLRLPYKERDCGVVLGQRAFTALGFSNGLHAEVHFLNQPSGQDAGYGFDVVGAEGTLALRRSVHTELFVQRSVHRGPAGSPAWERVVVDEGAGLQPAGPPLPSHTADAGAQRHACQRRLLRDLLDAIEQDRPPSSSGEDGLKALELVMAVWESHRQHAPVALPLARREHPLEAWLAESGLPVPTAAGLEAAAQGVPLGAAQGAPR
jgi:predicted dehydrogenase